MPQAVPVPSFRPGFFDQPVELDAELLLSGRFQTIGSNEYVMYKPRWGAFYRTGLEQWLRDSEVDTVVVGGCNLPNCPRATLFQASERDFRAVVLADATSQVRDDRIADLALIGVLSRTVGEVIEGLAQ